jgi:hypothetical protein
MVVERGAEDRESRVHARFPRLFQGYEDVSKIPPLTWPTTTFNDRMTVYLGKRRVDLMLPGTGAYSWRHRHLMCRTRTSCSPATSSNITRRVIVATAISTTGRDTGSIRAYDVDAIAPGRGDALVGREMVNAALDEHRRLSSPRPTNRSQRLPRVGGSLKDAMGCLPRRVRSEVQGLCDLRALPAVQRRARL